MATSKSTVSQAASQRKKKLEDYGKSPSALAIEDRIKTEKSQGMTRGSISERAKARKEALSDHKKKK